MNFKETLFEYLAEKNVEIKQEDKNFIADIMNFSEKNMLLKSEKAIKFV